MGVRILGSPAEADPSPMASEGAQGGVSADEVRETHGRSSGVRILTGSEDVAAAYCRVKDFERRTAEVMVEREERHRAALARSATRSDGARPFQP
jgi:hypothetical protein